MASVLYLVKHSSGITQRHITPTCGCDLRGLDQDHNYRREERFLCKCITECVLTGSKVVMFDHVALEAAPRGEVFGAIGHGAAVPQRAGVLLVFLGVDVEAAACRELGVTACEDPANTPH